MKIQEVLKPYYSTNLNPLMQFMEQIRLNNSLKTMIETSTLPGWKLFGKLINIRFSEISDPVSRFHPDHVIRLCQELNLEEFETLSSWIANLGICDESGFLSIFMDDVLYIPDTMLQPMSMNDLFSFLLNKTGIDPHMTDSQYQILSVADLSRVVASCPSSRFIYVSEKRDCDDFSRIFRGWLSEQGYGNLAFGYCEYNAFDAGGNYLFAHAVIIAVVSGVNGDYQIKLIEPQRDNVIYSVDEPQGLFSNVASIKIRMISI